MRLLVSVWMVGLWLWTMPDHVRAQAPAEDAVEVVWVGSAGEVPELQRVVAELLARDGVSVAFDHTAQFHAEALLAQPDTDRRVRVFVALPSPQLARLYLRGPYGRRFLLRELSLRSGVDELGRESIAHVVATSIDALLHANAGVDRQTVVADLSREGVEVSTAATPPSPRSAAASTPPETAADALRWGVALGLRNSVRATGDALGARWGAGIELGATQAWSHGLQLRQRVVIEHAIAQSLETAELLAFVTGSTLRIGQDVALASGVHRGVLGVSGGVDVLRIAPRRAREPSWSIAPAYTEWVPVLRAELRYELVLPWVYVALSATCDASLRAVRMSVRDGAEARPVAQLATLQPGLSFVLGWHTP